MDPGGFSSHIDGSARGQQYLSSKYFGQKGWQCLSVGGHHDPLNCWHILQYTRYLLCTARHSSQVFA